MIHRFGAFEIDEDLRALRLSGREIPLQPRVFELLVYLVHHRDRVVGKEELLEALWPSSMVVDAALQRVVSLARSALAQGGARDALRTYARHGYRFCADVAGGDARAGARQPSDALGDARCAYEKGKWAHATDAFAALGGSEELGTEDLERWGHAAMFAGRGAEAIGALERVAAAHASAGDVKPAARAALLLAHLHTDRMEAAIAQGWVRRAATFLADQAPSPERGRLAWIASRLALFEENMEEALARADEAYHLGRQFEDLDLECLGLLCRAHALVGLGDTEDGIAALDEAAAAVMGGRVSPWITGLIYCGLIYICRNRCDWQRAAQWTENFTRWCNDSSFSAFPGTCRLHRAEVLGARGELEHAGREASDIGVQLGRIAPWAQGDAFRVLGEIRLAQGDLDAADEAFQRANALGWNPQPGLALLQLARGQASAAVRGLERALEDKSWFARQRRGLILARLVIAALAAGQVDRARQALETLDARPDLWSTPALNATVTAARAEVAASASRWGEATALLRQALQLWQEIGAPLNAAETRTRLAELLLAEGDPDAARMEVSAALPVLQTVGSDALRARCERVRDRVGK